MAVQNSGNLTTIPFVRGGEARKESVTFAQDAQRSGAVAAYTLLAKVLATGYYTTFTDPTATDGTQWPAAICEMALTEAEVQAGDISDFVVITHGNPVTFDEGQLTIENSKTMDTEITSPSGIDMTVRDWLKLQGLIGVTTTDVTAYEA